MKKQFVFAMAAILSLTALSGCSSNSASATTAAATTAAAADTTAAPETTAAADTTAAPESSAEAAKGDGSLEKVLQAGKLVMGTSPDFAPWEFKDVSSGSVEYVGSDIELGKYIAEQLGVELEIKPMEFSAILQAINSDTVDIGISGFAYTDERAEAMNLSTNYNINSKAGQGLLVMKDQVSVYNTAEAFAGKKVATQNASLQYKLATEQLPSDVTIQPVTNVTDGVMMLTTGKVDALAVSGDNGESLAKTYPEVAMAEFMFDYTNDGNVIGIKKGNDDLTAAINEIVEKVNEEGLYEQWKQEATKLADSLGIETN